MICEIGTLTGEPAASEIKSRGPTMTRRLLTLLLALLLVPAARADVKLNELFTDNMVLQQGRDVAVWGTADPGEGVSVSFSDGPQVIMNVTRANADGRWKTTLPAMSASTGDTGRELTVRAKNIVTLKNVLVGEVWVCSGQSNMEWSVRASFEPEKTIKASKDPGLRLYTVAKKVSMTPLTAVPGTPKWLEASPETTPGFSAVAYFFGKYLRETRKVPVGLIHTSWGGTPAESWTSRGALDAEPELRYYHEKLASAIKNYDPEKAKADYQRALANWEDESAKANAAGKPQPRKPQPPAAPGTGPFTPSSLYNAMIAPLIPCGIAGAIWYQGESNAGKAYEYRTLFKTMITDWRRNWGQGEFPFLFVQLAPFDAGPQPNWPELREAQFLALQLPKTGMAVITDVGEHKDIHPKKKQPVGERLGLAARAIAYGEQIDYSGPVYSSMSIVGNKVVLRFAHAAGGLEAKGGKLTGFTIAGSDQKFVPADAEITGPDTITVSAGGVAQPEAVRFGWANYPEVDLFNKAGLPATPFRTDTWPLLTQPKTSGAK
jgi:sialate O-acetylesterase